MINRDLDWDKIRDRGNHLDKWLHGRFCDRPLDNVLYPASIRVHQTHRAKCGVFQLDCYKRNRLGKFTVYVVLDPEASHLSHLSSQEVAEQVSDRIATRMGIDKTYPSAAVPKLLHGRVIPITLQGLFEGHYASALKTDLALKSKIGDRYSRNYQILYWLGVFWQVAEPKYLAWLIWSVHKDPGEHQSKLAAIWREMDSGYWIEAMQLLLGFYPIVPVAPIAPVIAPVLSASEEPEKA